MDVSLFLEVLENLIWKHNEAKFSLSEIRIQFIAS